MDFDTSDLKQLFFEESDEFVELMESSLLELEHDPTNADTLAQIFRSAHSIKGGSGSLGMNEVMMFTHALETLLDQLRKGAMTADSDIIAMLLECVDHLRDLLDAARNDTSSPSSAALLARLEIIIDGGKIGQEKEVDEETFRKQVWEAVAAAQAEEAGETPKPAEPVVKPPSTLKPAFDEDAFRKEVWAAVAEAEADDAVKAAAQAPDKSLDELDKLMDEAAPAKPVVSEPVHDPAPHPTAVAAQADDPKKAAHAAEKGENQVLRISADKVDKLINLVGELVIHQSMLIDAAGPSPTPALASAVSAISQATRELQEKVLAVRMLPIKQLFGRFPRVVRDLGRSCGKQVNLETSGEETELDKMVIEGLADPLTHLIRNSVDHGLETPADRTAVGKPEFGTVSLRARHESGNIILEVADDGKGLDREKILKKAIDNGMVGADDQLTDEQIYSLIYQPGFSTAKVVSDVSGRGVGMDIVLQAIRTLGGSITVSSRPGFGTTFRIKLPLTMAIVEGLTVKVGNELYVMPLTNIVECIKPNTSDIHMLAGQGEMLNLRQSCLPVTRLATMFGVPTEVTDYKDGVLVIVEDGSRRAALLVDELIGQNQVVVKSLETNYGNVAAFAGATILGDGKVALIIDIASLPVLATGGTAYAVAA
jgi:two-component system chemotaxis sensor kinase CheA